MRRSTTTSRNGVHTCALLTLLALLARAVLANLRVHHVLRHNGTQLAGQNARSHRRCRRWVAGVLPDDAHLIGLVIERPAIRAEKQWRTAKSEPC
eukprot:1780891-Prymnesium_polylepis.2